MQFWDPETGDTQLMLQGHKNSGKSSSFRIDRRRDTVIRSPPAPSMQTDILLAFSNFRGPQPTR